jgi:sugar transferase EpsL
MIKRLFDIIFSMAALITCSPLLLLISFLILIIDGKPILFKQSRSGLNQHPFKFYKFRTMKNKKSEHGSILQDSDRITHLGRLLRKTSLDELPTFINVLKGEMSVVGPRPLLERYLTRYDDFQIRRLKVKPGITGLAQIRGRNNLSWEEKFFFDVNYIDNQNLFLDIKIIIITIISVFTRKGISPNTQEIMPEFTGSDINESFNKTKPK